jgi:hypothetical protein
MVLAAVEVADEGRGEGAEKRVPHCLNSPQKANPAPLTASPWP